MDYFGDEKSIGRAREYVLMVIDILRVIHKMEGSYSTLDFESYPELDKSWLIFDLNCVQLEDEFWRHVYLSGAVTCF